MKFWRFYLIVVILCSVGSVTHGQTKRYDRYFRRYAILHGISPSWVKATAIAESNLNPRARSRAGAVGLMQFIPGTWEWMAPSYLKALGPSDPKAAIWVGSKYLRWNIDRVPKAEKPEGERLASASYNSGWGNVRKARAVCRDRGCNPEVWYDSVEKCLVTSAASQKETRTYVARIDRWKKRGIL